MTTRLIAIVLAVVFSAAVTPPAQANKLADSGSPYLLLHADNPVNWYPWGPEALEKAKRENKPIFLSVGYSTCYWCHVAEQTIYSKQAFADLMNAWFVNIKVDREQRPDIDSIYMLATRLMTGRGGWPNNLFLTPDLKPIFAGSYFPPYGDEYGRPGFDAVLKSIHRRWTDDRAGVVAAAEKNFSQLQSAQSISAAAGPVRSPAWLQMAIDDWSQRFDAQHGGFGNNNKFPYPTALSLMLHAGAARDDPRLRAIAEQSLTAMAQGGIHDQLAGGFHRYATDLAWALPHFEKMLYDNAQLLQLYADAYRLTGDSYYRHVAAGIANYLMQHLMSAEGGFYTAEDAAIDGVEGASYLWTRREIASVLGGEAANRFLAAYALTAVSDQDKLQTPEQVVDGETYGVLRLRLPIAESLARTGSADLSAMIEQFAPMRERLREARDKRRQPARDEKMVVGLNGLAIEAFAASADALNKPALIDAARRSAERVYRLAFFPAFGRLKHEIFKGRAQTDAFLDDYALLGRGFLALHAATGEKVWLQRAAGLADAMLHRFARADGTLATSPAEKDLLIPPPEEGDPVVPSGTSAAVDLLLRLGQELGEPKYSSAARRVVERHSARLDKSAGFWSVMVAALNFTGFERTIDATSALGEFDTARHVRVSATNTSGGGADEITIVLEIAPKYHVNANPASFDYLIPTEIAFSGLTPDEIRYPKATLFKPDFEPSGLAVFEGRVEIGARFPEGAFADRLEVQAMVSVQACNDEVCLPPARIPLTVRIAR